MAVQTGAAGGCGNGFARPESYDRPEPRRHVSGRWWADLSLASAGPSLSDRHVDARGVARRRMLLRHR